MTSDNLYRLQIETHKLQIKILELKLQLEPYRRKYDVNNDEDDNNSTQLSAESFGLDYAKAKSFIRGLEFNRDYPAWWIINELIGRTPSSRGEKTVCTNFLKRIGLLELSAPKRGERPGKRESEFGLCYYYRRTIPALPNMENGQ